MQGKLSGKLGVEGYNPAATGKGEAAQIIPAQAASPVPSETKSDSKDEGTVEERIDKAISTISRYRTGGDGGTALQTLKAYCTNALKPDEKFRTINMDNNAFKTRVKPFVGGVALLKAIGFVKDEAENKLFLAEATRNEELINETISKLERAIQSYQY